MWNASPISLRNEQVFLSELTIGQVMQIARLPEALNESRISSLIAFATGDEHLPQRLTVSERYFVLLNYLMLSNSDYNHYAQIDSMTDFFLSDGIDTTHVPDFVVKNGVYVQQLTGAMATALEGKCENTYDWLTGQMACQMYGDMSDIFHDDVNADADGMSGDVQEPIIWAKATSDNAHELENIINERFELINALPASKFEKLAANFYESLFELRHLVEVVYDNEGVYLVATSEGGGSAHRFCALSGLGEITRRLSECVAK